MKDWRGDQDSRRKWLLPSIGAAVLLLLVGWIIFSRPGEESLSSTGFREDGPGMITGSHFSEYRPKSGVAFAPIIPNTPAPLSVTGAPPVAPSEVPAAEAAAPSAPAAKPANPNQPADDGVSALSAPGVRADPSGLTQMGLKDKLMVGALRKLMEHPAVLGYLLNNKMLVNAFLARGDVQKTCSSAAAQKAWLMNTDPGRPNGVSDWIPLVREGLHHPDAVAVALDSELGRHTMDCPSVKELVNDPHQVLQIAASIPGGVGLLIDPSFAQALSSNPQAASMLNAAQSAVSGTPSP